MARPNAYHMQDQVRDRVRLIMRSDNDAVAVITPWLLIAVVAALALLNIMPATPLP